MKSATFVLRCDSLDGVTPMPTPALTVIAPGVWFLGSFAAAVGTILLGQIQGLTQSTIGPGGAFLVTRVRLVDPTLTLGEVGVIASAPPTLPTTAFGPPQEIQPDDDGLALLLPLLNQSQGLSLSGDGAGPVLVVIDGVGGTPEEILGLCNAQSVNNTGSSAISVSAVGPTPPAPADGLYPNLFDYSVNHARVEKVTPVRCIVGSQANIAGSYNGGGIGNKCMAGVRTLNGGAPLLISALGIIRYRWRPKWGPMGRVPFGGVFGSPVTVLQPYCNILVRFSPIDVRVLAVLTPEGQATPALNVGSYTDNGDGTATFEWDPAVHFVHVVGAPPAPGPAGVLPAVTIPPGLVWQENSWDWQALIAADPFASVVDGTHPDGGVGVGTNVPQVFVSMGDSGNLALAELELLEFSVGGDIIIAP
jgi:hypothetical protein